MLLFIEDDIFFMESLTENFLEMGYSVITASDPDEALAAAKNLGTQIQCIILDIMMRPGTSFSLLATQHGYHTGMNVYTSIRSQLPNTPVIVWTALQDSKPENQSVPRFFSQQKECEYYRKTELLPHDLFEHIRANFSPASKSKGQWIEMAQRMPKTPSASPQPIAPLSYNTASIRELLTAAFDDEELTIFCYDHFRTVSESFSAAMSKSQKIQWLIEHCERNLLIDPLLEHLRRENPAQYAIYESRRKE